VCCASDNQNDWPEVVSCTAAPNAWEAWEYDPSCDIAIGRLEIHVPGGQIALLADDLGSPGAVLFQGDLAPTGTPGWSGTEISPAMPVAPGQHYWIASKSHTCSLTRRGTPSTQFDSLSLAGPWGWQFQNTFTAHVLGACP
jgi:hypothetical protein